MFRRALVSRVQAIERFGDVEVLWEDLLRRGVRRPAFRVVRSGATVADRAVTRRAGIGNHELDDLISANDVVDHYRRGDTVVAQGLHHTNPHLARVANNLALALDHPVQINAYFSPANAKGLDLHFDFHDVFVVQLRGSKHWRVWAPLDRTTEPVKARHAIPAPRLDELGDPLLDITMTTGDCLYLPRGYPHSAETSDEHSDHLTVGLVAVMWHRVLRRAIEAEVAAGRLTAALPVRLLDPGNPAPIDGAGIDHLARLLTPATIRQWLAREIWRRQPATRVRPRLVPSRDPEPLALTPGPLLWLTTVADRAVLGIGDRLLDMPVEAHAFLSALLGAESPLDAGHLPGLDADSRTVVVRRLLAEGILVHAG